jgi:peptidyl-prolyl cis-trans isomerase C
MTMTVCRLLLIALAGFGLVGVAQPKAPEPVMTPDEAQAAAERALAFIPKMAASFDGGMIEGEQIRQLMRPQLQAQLRMGVQIPQARLQQWALALTESELDHQLLLGQATAAGYKPDLFTARQELAERRRQMGEEAYARTMAMQGVDEDVVVRKLAENQMVNQWMAEQVAPTVNVDEDEARHYYKEHKDEFKMPEARRLWHILIAKRLNVPQKRLKFFRQNAEDMLGRLREGMSFQRLARSGSDCPSAPNGGDLGLVPDDKLNKAVRSTVAKLVPGQISDVVESPEGYHIFMAGAATPGRQLKFDEVSQRIMRRLQGETVGETMKRMKETARAASHAQVFIRVTGK